MKKKVLSTQTNWICRLIDGLWKASSPRNVSAEFRSAGILLTCRMIDGTPKIQAGVRRAVQHYETLVLEKIVESNLELSES